MKRALLANLAVALAYFLAANLARLFAIAPDYFAPFFLAAGIAMAVCVNWGATMLPGVAMGALIFNAIWLVPLDGSHAIAAWAAALAVAAGSTLQAWCGAQLFSRFSGAGMVTGRHIVAFLLLVPLSCLVGASIGIASVVALGRMSGSNILPNWVIWWLGDTVGVLLGAPLAWVAMGRPQVVWQRRRWTVGVPLVLCSCAFLALYNGVRNWEEERQQNAFQLNAHQVADLLQFQFDEQQRVLNFAVQTISEFEGHSPERFARLANNYLRSRPELRLMSMARHVSAADKAAFESWARQTIAPNFTIHAARPRTQAPTTEALRPESDEYYPNIFVEPMLANSRVLGLDLLSEATRAEMVRRTLRDKAAMVASGPVALVQSDDAAPAILLAQHVQLPALPNVPGTDGVVVVVMEVEPYLGKTLARAGFGDYAMHLSDVQAPSTVLPAKASVRGSRVFERHLRLGDRSYLLTIEDPSARQALTEWGSWAVLTFGLLLSAMVGAFLLLLSGQREQTEQFNRELSNTLTQLTMTQRELVQTAKLASLGAMVAGLSHELNTPLGNCLLAASTLEGRTADLAHMVDSGNIKRSAMGIFLADAHQACNLLLRNLRRATGLVSHFKQMAVDQHTEHRQVFNLSELVSHAVDQLSGALQERCITVTQDVDPSIELNSYPAALGHVLLTVLNNALLHAFEGRERGQITIAASRVDNAVQQVTMRVVDDGVGIAPDHLERVFDPFFTTKMADGSYGLGLAIAHNMVSGILGGVLEVSSQPGHGSSFSLVLPLTT